MSDKSNTQSICLHPRDDWVYYNRTPYCSVCNKKIFGLKLKPIIELIIHVMFGCFILGAILSVIGFNGYSNLKFNVNADKEGIE